MLNEQQRDSVQHMSRTLQIIIGSMAAGVLVFACVVLVLFQDDNKLEQDALPMISYLAAGAGVLAMSAAAIVPRMVGAINANQFEAGDLERVLNTYQTRVIIGAAILEGVAFFNLIAHMLEGQMINVILTGVLLVGILMRFPTANGIETWLEAERKKINELQSLGN